MASTKTLRIFTCNEQQLCSIFYVLLLYLGIPKYCISLCDANYCFHLLIVWYSINDYFAKKFMNKLFWQLILKWDVGSWSATDCGWSLPCFDHYAASIHIDKSMSSIFLVLIWLEESTNSHEVLKSKNLLSNAYDMMLIRDAYDRYNIISNYLRCCGHSITSTSRDQNQVSKFANYWKKEKILFV